MTNIKLVDKWKKILGLNEYRTYLDIITKEEMIEENKLAYNGVCLYCNEKKLIIIKVINPTERTIIHELLHVKYQDYSENKIEKLTIKYMKDVKKGVI